MKKLKYLIQNCFHTSKENTSAINKKVNTRMHIQYYAEILLVSFYYILKLGFVISGEDAKGNVGAARIIFRHTNVKKYLLQLV